MNEKGLFTVTPEGFTPTEYHGDDRALVLHQQLLKRFGETGRPVFLTVRTARNPEFSAMAHVVFSKLAKGLGVSMEAIKNYLKEATGRYDLEKMPNGHVIKVRHSVAFSAMSEEQFRAFWEAALPVILEQLLGGVRSAEYQEICDILEGKRR